MNLDQLQARWAENDRRLDAALRLNRELLRERAARPFRTRLQLFTLLLAAEAALNVAILFFTGSFLFHHWNEPRFALPAAALHLWLIAALGSCIYLLVQARGVDHTNPVPELQRQLAALRMSSLRATKWALLTGQLVWWLPFLIVSAKAAVNLDLYAVLPAHFLIANLAFGLAVIPLATWAARHFAADPVTSPALAWLTGQLAGTQLNEATRFLDTLADFEREPRP